MTMIALWRIGATTRTYTADDLSGVGSAIHGGRWNAEGQRVLYTSRTIALAVLETAAHVPAGNLPRDRYVVRIGVPEEDYRQRRVLSTAMLPADWDAIPGSATALALGSQWYVDASELLLEVPSVVVPEESALIVNATHPSAKHVTSELVRKFDYGVFWRS